jgi:hypothetical protein
MKSKSKRRRPCVMSTPFWRKYDIQAKSCAGKDIGQPIRNNK